MAPDASSPRAEVKAARDVLRYRTKVAQQRVSEIARLGNVLQDAGIKIDSVAWSWPIATKSGRLERLLDGDPARRASRLFCRAGQGVRTMAPAARPPVAWESAWAASARR